MYTELATMYAKCAAFDYEANSVLRSTSSSALKCLMDERYKPKMLMDFIKMNVQKLNIPKLIHACERHYHWEHAVFLYMHYDEYDQAANTMMAHSPIAFAHDQFLMIMQKVSNMELYYRAVQFYLDEQCASQQIAIKGADPSDIHAFGALGRFSSTRC